MDMLKKIIDFIKGLFSSNIIVGNNNKNKMNNIQKNVDCNINITNGFRDNENEK